MKIKKYIKKFFAVFLIIFIICIVTILINVFLNEFIFVTRYQINNSKIPNKFEGYKILQLTDIHSIRDIKQKEKIINKVKKESPDCICITGDLIDAEYYSNENNKYENGEIQLPDNLTVQLVSELLDISENVYFIYGNHEMMLLDNPEKNVFKVSLEEMGVKILNNKTDVVKIDNDQINIVGIQDPATLYKDKKYAYIGNNKYDKVKQILDDIFKNESLELAKEKFTILLSHRPEYFELYSKYQVDLALTGHTHGGVVKLPIIGGLYAHPQGWFPDFTSGIYKKENLEMIVGRGIGYSQIPIRIFNPPEIISITLSN